MAVMAVTTRKISAAKLQKIAEAFKAIGHPVRIEILSVLELYERLTVHDIQEKISARVEQSMLSHHLIKMKDKGILQCEKEGHYVYYSLKDPSISNLLDCMANCKL
jgi:ArsR family transcriptional regulator